MKIINRVSLIILLFFTNIIAEDTSGKINNVKSDETSVFTQENIYGIPQNYSSNNIIKSSFPVRNKEDHYSSLNRTDYLLDIDSVYYVHGDTALLPINNISVTPLSSIELKISGYQGMLELVEIVTDESTILGDLGWFTFYNDTDSLLVIASAGTMPINGTGTLFKLKLAIPIDVESQFVSVEINSFVGDEIYTNFSFDPGGVQVVWGPEIAFNADIVSGPYPLEVNFTDLSSSGTYPIESWVWDFGNDSSSQEQNSTFTYLYPGEYDISLLIEDGFGLLDTLIYPSMIQVDTVYGDVTFNTLVQSYDAAIILKYLVGMESLSSIALEIADVSLNNVVTTLDAYYILQYMVGLIESLPYTPEELLASGGEFQMDDIDAAYGELVNIPIKIENAENVNGFYGTLVYDPIALALDTIVFAEFLDNYLIEYNELQPGKIKIAASGNQSDLNYGDFAYLSFYVLEGMDEYTAVTLEDVSINENKLFNIAATMKISSLLISENNEIPEEYMLYQNYPNPFNPQTSIDYDLPQDGIVEISIFNIMGTHIKTLVNLHQTAGYHSVKWNAKNSIEKPVSAGVYMYTIKVGNFQDNRKMILLK